MPDYCIITGSTADLPSKVYKENDIRVLCYSFVLQDKETYHDPLVPIDYHAFYDSMRNGALPTTSNLNQMTIGTAVKQCFEQGRDVLYIVFSSGLSSTYQVAQSTQQTLMEQYPHRKLILIDSLGASFGQGMLTLLAARCRKEDLTIEDAAQKLMDMRLRVAYFITVSDLDHLFRGGRISRAAAAVGRLASIKPILTIDQKGHLVQIEKVNGRRKSIRKLVDLTKAALPDYETFDTAYILHGDSMEDAEKLREKLMEETSFKHVEIHPLGPIIGAHTGPDMLAVVFLSKRDRTT